MKSLLLICSVIAVFVVAYLYYIQHRPVYKHVLVKAIKEVPVDTMQHNRHSNRLRANLKVDSIVIHKSARKLIAFSKGKAVLRYRVALGLNPVGAKQVQGDYKTPEGLYRINGKNANSLYHKNLGISYPNNADRARAMKLGQSPGGDIKIHGLPNGSGYIGKRHLLADWTWGCIALTNEEIDELYKYVKIGVPVLITA